MARGLADEGLAALHQGYACVHVRARFMCMRVRAYGRVKTVCAFHMHECALYGLFACMRLCVHACMLVCVYKSVSLHARVCVCFSVCVRAFVCACMYA